MSAPEPQEWIVSSRKGRRLDLPNQRPVAYQGDGRAGDGSSATAVDDGLWTP